MVEYLPDPLIPFAGSQLTQSTSVRLGANSGFIGWETIAAGRTSRGEEFEFTSLASEFGIRSDARPLAIERYRLVPAVRDPRSVARWGRFRYSGTLYICHTGIGMPVWLRLESCLNELASIRTDQTVRWGVSALCANGLVVRGLGLEAHHVASGLHAFWEHAKRDIWAEPAIPPRKIN
jgi:urease accessory protein